MTAASDAGRVARYVVLKASGSRFAYVQDTETACTVARYDILRDRAGVDGWTCATTHAKQLNERAILAADGDNNGERK